MVSMYRLVVGLAVLLCGGVTMAQAQDPRLVLFEDPSVAATRLHYPLFLSAEGRGYRIHCPNQAEEEAIIRGLGFTTVPSQILTAADPSITAAAPASNPLLCPSAPDFKIQVFASEGPDGVVHYLQFPSGVGSSSVTDRLYIPGCSGLANALKIDLTQAQQADPTPFFQGKIHEISCLNGTPIDVVPKDVTAWCLKGDRTPAETATVVALLETTPGGTSALGNKTACAEAQSFLSSIPSLDLDNRGVQSLAPLSVLTQLTSLSLANNQITDLSPLAKLGALTSLDVSGNRVTSIVALAPLTKLTRLDLDENQIQDIRFVSALTLLTSLSLNGNALLDLTPLQRLPALTKLFLARNKLTGEQLEPLTALGLLTTLDLSGNQIETFASLGQFPSTVEIDLRGNPIVASEVRSFLDLCILHRDAPTPFGETLRLIVQHVGGGPCNTVNEKVLSTTTLDLSKKAINDVGPVGVLTHLTALNLADNAITDVRALSGLVNLTDLNVGGNRITDIRPIGPLTKLTQFEATGNPITVTEFLSACFMRKYEGVLTEAQSTEVTALLDLSGKTTCRAAHDALRRLTVADVSNRGLASLDYFAVLESVKDLNVSRNRLKDLSALRPLRDLTVLSVWSNEISSMDAVNALPQLEGLILDANPINSLDGIGNLRKLKKVYFSSTKIQAVDPLLRLPLLEEARMRNLPLTLRRFAEYCLVHRFDPIALRTDRPLMEALETTLVAAGGDPKNCEAAEQWAQRLQILTLNKKGLISVEPLRFFTDLRELNLYDNAITDVHPLAGLPQLTAVNLNANRIVSPPQFVSPQLKQLSVNDNNVQDVLRFSSLTQLTSLSLNNNAIIDPRPLAGLAALTWLDLRNNRIGQIPFVWSVLPRNPYLNGNPVCQVPANPQPPFTQIREACNRRPFHFIPGIFIPDRPVFRPDVIRPPVVEPGESRPPVVRPPVRRSDGQIDRDRNPRDSRRPIP